MKFKYFVAATLLITFLVNSCSWFKDYETIYFKVKVDNKVDNCVLRLPEDYSDNNGSIQLVMMAHGAGGGVLESNWYLGNKSTLDDTLLANGYAVFDCMGFEVNNMGNPKAIASYQKALEYIKSNFKVKDEVVLVGMSMGGLTALNFAAHTQNKIKAMFFYSAVMDLKTQAWDNPWFESNRQDIARLYDFEDKSGLSYEYKRIRDWNPVNVESDTIIIKSKNIPIKIWHGVNDKVVASSVSKYMLEQLAKANYPIEAEFVNTSDHQLSAGTDKINHEAVLWLNKICRNDK